MQIDWANIALKWVGVFPDDDAFKAGYWAFFNNADAPPKFNFYQLKEWERGFNKAYSTRLKRNERRNGRYKQT